MKKIKKVLAVTLASCALFAAGCIDSTESGEKQAVELTVNEHGYYEKGIHEINYTTTSDYLVKDNKTEYAILIPDNASYRLKFAASELNKFFYEATTSQLTLVTDASAGEYSADKKFISLGATTYADAANVKPTKELDEYGYTIQTVGKSVFINANSDIGVCNGVYGFLELQFNYDCFSDVCYTIDKQDDSSLLDFEVRDVPDFKNRLETSQYQDGNAVYQMKLGVREELMAGHTTSVHSSLRVMPFETYGEHAKWYSPDRAQLCYAAQGDAEERALMIDTVANIFIGYMKESTIEQRYISFGQMDHSTWCTCDVCKEYYLKYGSNCAVQIQFINEVAAKVQAWMETEEGKPYERDFEIMYLVYQKTIDAPTVWDEAKGEYVPVDDTVIPAEHTLPMYAPIEFDYQCDVYDECNKEELENLRKWKPIFEQSECAIFSYWQNYTSFWLYYDHYTNIQNWYRVLAELNVDWFTEEGQRAYLAGGGGTAWSALRSYISAKLSWNVNLDVDELTQRFFKYYYDDAADEMYQTFLATRAVASRNRDAFCSPTGSSNGKYQTITYQKYWPEELATSSIARIEKGLSDIAYLKKLNPKKYQMLYKNIVAERFSYEYILIEFYADNYDADYMQVMKKQAKKDAEDNNIYYFGQRPDTTAQDIWNKWGV